MNNPFVSYYLVRPRFRRTVDGVLEIARSARGRAVADWAPFALDPDERRMPMAVTLTDALLAAMLVFEVLIFVKVF